jgi:hypothetical protein
MAAVSGLGKLSRIDSLRAIACLIDTAADAEGSPLPDGIAERIAHRLTTAVPEILDAMMELAKGKVS